VQAARGEVLRLLADAEQQKVAAQVEEDWLAQVLALHSTDAGVPYVRLSF
jgi:hypothetical protein